MERWRGVRIEGNHRVREIMCSTPIYLQNKKNYILS
jgi:hypothetical protein